MYELTILTKEKIIIIADTEPIVFFNALGKNSIDFRMLF